MPKHRLFRFCAFLLVLVAARVQAQTVTTFEGIDASQVTRPENDVDPNGAIGTKQFMEWTNVYYQAWDKTTFKAVWSTPQAGTSPFTANGNANCASISGDGVIIFDRLASRWVIAAHNSGSTNYYYCVAVSNTDDLSSASLAWYTYAIPLNNILGTNALGTTYFPDWPKIATWPDAYYVAMDLEDPNNKYQEVGSVACALDRANMLIGGTANTPQCFLYPNPVTGSLNLGHSLQPADVEGTTPPPAGQPEYFASIQNPVADGVTTTSSEFNLWQFHVDWANPANSTFTQSTVPVTAYTPGCYTPGSVANTICVPEPSTSVTNQAIDSVGDRFMFRFSYRNYGTSQSYLVSHTVQVGTAKWSQTGIRWYELRGSVPSLYQSGTISPDQSLYRFMPSIAQDQAGNAAVAYSTSSSSAHPGMSASWWNLNAQPSPTEFTLYNGKGDLENTYHWGDYSSLTVDPVGGCAFWYVNEYFNNNQTGTSKPIWQTRISTFTAPGCGSVGLAPSSLSFGSQAVGIPSASQHVVLTNGDSTAISINGIGFGGTNPGDFKQTNNCGSSLASGSFCTINVTFDPTASGSRSAILNVSDTDPSSPQSVNVSGNGVNGSSLGLSVSSISFGNQAYGVGSNPVPVTVTNNGNATVTFSSIRFSGVNPGNFSESDNCQPSLAAGNSCIINVTFTPSTTGSYSATMTLTDNASNNPQSVKLTGTGVIPVTLSASSLKFGTVYVGASKAAPAITLTSTMNVPLTGITIAVAGAGFSEVDTCGSSIPAAGTCTITVSFAPTSQGTVHGTVTITDNAANSPQVISLTGYGAVPVVLTPLNIVFGTLKVGTTSPYQTVTVTNKETTAIKFTNITFAGTDPGDFSATTNCGASLPAGASCSIHVKFKPTATGPRSATMNLNDSAPSSPQQVTVSGVGN